MPELIIERLNDEVEMPRYAKEGDSGFDLSSTEDWVIGPGLCEKISTGLRFHIPEGYEVQIRPRSGLSILGLPAQFGTIDQGYRGEVIVILANISKGTKRIRKGERIAQAVLVPVTQANIVEGVVSTDTERGEAGFGSTGR